MNNSSRLTTVSAAFGLMLALGSGVAQADERQWIQSETALIDAEGVRAGDPQAVEDAYASMRAAARDACSVPRRFRRNLGAPQIDYGCVRDAMARAVADLNAPALTAYAAAQDMARGGGRAAFAGGEMQTRAARPASPDQINP